jgi:predicted dehydrogenase
MKQLHFGIVGAGYWTQFQAAAWNEIQGVQCVAICDRTPSKAAALARRFGIPDVYHDAEALLNRSNLDFVDIVTDNCTHHQLVRMCADRRLPVICQKPMAPTYGECVEMVEACRTAGVPFLIHENWRWQRPIRALKAHLVGGAIGRPVRANLSILTSVDDLQGQPFLKELERMVLADVGVHLLDTTRFLFGEAETVYCRNARVQQDIKGEDVATVMLGMASGMTVLIQIAFAQIPLERDYYVQTNVFVEGERGSVELAPDYWLRVTTTDGTLSRRYPPARYGWGDPALEVSTSSIVDCHLDLVRALRGESRAETTGEDNLRTMRLMEACYESAGSGALVRL